MISVLVSLYNGERFVIEQLESIRTQTMPVDHVILADDGSTDGTLALVENFIKKHSLRGWSVIQNSAKRGPAGNSFGLLERATGDFIFMADQDDVWESNKVETVVAHFAAHGEVVAVASTELLIDQQGDAILDPSLVKSFGRKVKHFRGWQALSVEDFLGTSSISWHATCVRRSVIQAARTAGTPDVGRTLGADWYVGLVACLVGEFHMLGTPLMQRRIHDTNASLGRLRRTTLLATHRLDRISLIEEVSNAHAYVLNSAHLADLLNANDRQRLRSIITFQEARASFTRTPNLITGWRLFRMLEAYRISLGSRRAALRSLGADALYASPISRARMSK